MKNLFSKTEKTQAASVTFYPDKIIVETEDIATNGIRLASTKLTILPVDASTEILGQTLRKHFSLTTFNVPHPTDFKKYWNEYKSAAGFQTDKSTYKDARRVCCSQTKNEIIFCPTENLYNTGYNHLTKIQTETFSDSSNLVLGEKLLEPGTYRKVESEKLNMLQHLTASKHKRQEVQGLRHKLLSARFASQIIFYLPPLYKVHIFE